MSQIALPLELSGGAETIVGGPSLGPVFAALQASNTWPYRTALLSGPPRSGKSLLARAIHAGGVRASAQMISYEISLGLSIIPAVMMFLAIAIVVTLHYRA